MSDAQQAGTAATSTIQPEEISVAVLYPGNRIDVMARPLENGHDDATASRAPDRGGHQINTND